MPFQHIFCILVNLESMDFKLANLMLYPIKIQITHIFNCFTVFYYA
jgi:hypothetical protein